MHLTIKPNYAQWETKAELEAQMSDFQIAREEMVSQPDMSIIGGSPIVRKAVYLGRYQLKSGFMQYSDTQYSHT